MICYDIGISKTLYISIIFLAGLLDLITMPNSFVIVVIQKPDRVNMMTPSLVRQFKNFGYINCLSHTKLRLIPLRAEREPQGW